MVESNVVQVLRDDHAILFLIALLILVSILVMSSQFGIGLVADTLYGAQLVFQSVYQLDMKNSMNY